MPPNVQARAAGAPRGRGGRQEREKGFSEEGAQSSGQEPGTRRAEGRGGRRCFRRDESVRTGGNHRIGWDLKPGRGASGCPCTGPSR